MKSPLGTLNLQKSYPIVPINKDSAKAEPCTVAIEPNRIQGRRPVQCIDQSNERPTARHRFVDAGPCER